MTALSLSPMADRVIVRLIPADDVTAGGVILPEQARETPQRATVLATGPEVEIVAVGDVVWVSQWAGVQVDHEGEELLFLRKPDLLAVAVE